MSFTPPNVAKYSEARNELLPNPADEKWMAPGFAFAYLINSATLVAGTAAFTVNRLGWSARSVTGAKSLRML